MFHFKKVNPLFECDQKDWMDWKWQLRHSLKTFEDFKKYFNLSKKEEKDFSEIKDLFKVQITPFFASLSLEKNSPLRKSFLPCVKEKINTEFSYKDPLAENEFSPVSRIIHRYPDRVLFLVTDFCGIYCRYCTRKHFTGKDQYKIRNKDYEKALSYISKNKGIREVILSGGDPLSLSDEILETYLKDLRQIDHIEIIRIGSRFFSINPMRFNKDFVSMIKKYQPVYLMSHINHPKEITEECKKALSLCLDHGIIILNQMVLIQGYNNHTYLLQALFRRLVYLRVKPYYLFQCDPSLGTSHLKTPISQSLQIQRDLWGHLSGICMPQISLDIPDGGGKVSFTPDFLTSKKDNKYFFKGWDGKKGVYEDPVSSERPEDFKDYKDEWERLKNQKYGKRLDDL